MNYDMYVHDGKVGSLTCVEPIICFNLEIIKTTT